MKTVDSTPREWAKIHREAQNELLRTEKRTLDSLREVVDNHTNSLLVELNGVTSELEASALIQGASDDLEDDFADAVEEGRVDAREGARDQLHEELLLLGLILVLRSRKRIDKVASAQTAKSFAATWARAAAAAVLMAEEQSFVESVRTAIRSLDSRVKSIATTEVAQAWNDEHSTAAEAAASKVDAEGEAVYSRWDATLDAKTCATCRDHDGEIVPLGHSFSDGDLPGFVHPNCRCLSTIVVIPASKAA